MIISDALAKNACHKKLSDKTTPCGAAWVAYCRALESNGVIDGNDFIGVIEAALAASPLDEVTRDRCEEAVDEILHHAKATGIEGGFNCGGISALQSATAAIRALPAVITQIEDKMRDRCKEAVWGLYAAPQVHPDDDARDGWQQACEAAVAAIGALPVAPPRPMPTPEAVAQAFCCPSPSVRCGDRGPSLRTCSASNFHDGATAVLKLFGKATP